MGSSYRRKWAVTAALVSGGAILLGLILVRQPFVRTARAEQEREEKYLFVWTGDQARTKPDFLAVIDFDKESNRYESVVTTVPLPGPGATGNEPHHLSLSADGKVLGAGGLLSVLKGQNEVFFFDVSHPRAPRFLSSANPPLSSITDDFYPLTQGGSSLP
jgi:selenium-binding protein 1